MSEKFDTHTFGDFNKAFRSCDSRLSSQDYKFQIVIIVEQSGLLEYHDCRTQAGVLTIRNA